MAYDPSDMLSQPGYGIPQLASLEQSTPPGYMTPTALAPQGGFNVSAGPSEANLAAILGLAKPAEGQILTAPVMGRSARSDTGGFSQLGPAAIGPMTATQDSEGYGIPEGVPLWQRIILGLAPPAIQQAKMRQWEMQRQTEAAREQNAVREAVGKRLRIGDIDGAENVLKSLGQRTRYMKEFNAISREIYPQINQRRIAIARADSLFYRAGQLVVDRIDENGNTIYKQGADPRAIALHRGMAEQRGKMQRGEPTEYGLAFVDMSGEQIAELEKSLGQTHVITSEQPLRLADTGTGEIRQPLGAYPPEPLRSQTPQTPQTPQQLQQQGPPLPPEMGEQPTQQPTQQQAQLQQQPQPPRQRGEVEPQYHTTPADVGLAEPERFIYGKMPLTSKGEQPNAAILSRMRNSDDPRERAEAATLENHLQNLRSDYQSMVDLFHAEDLSRSLNAVGVGTARQLFEMTQAQRTDAIIRADKYYKANNAAGEALRAHELFVGQLQRDYDRVLNPLHDIHTLMRATDPTSLPDRLKNMVLGAGAVLRIPGLNIPITLQLPPQAEVFLEGIWRSPTDQQRFLEFAREIARQALSTLTSHPSRDAARMKLLLDDRSWASPQQARQATATLINVLEEERHAVGQEDFGRRREKQLVDVPSEVQEGVSSPDVIERRSRAREDQRKADAAQQERSTITQPDVNVIPDQQGRVVPKPQPRTPPKTLPQIIIEPITKAFREAHPETTPYEPPPPALPQLQSKEPKIQQGKPLQKSYPSVQRYIPNAELKRLNRERGQRLRQQTLQQQQQQQQQIQPQQQPLSPLQRFPELEEIYGR